jgi:hypothetical protein
LKYGLCDVVRQMRRKLALHFSLEILDGAGRLAPFPLRRHWKARTGRVLGAFVWRLIAHLPEPWR